MTRQTELRHSFVDTVPNKLEVGVLYVCIPYATAVHQCCCGCGNEVVTPLSPDDWELTFNGESVSLNPSIGNWSFACQSHYWIEYNQVWWARRWSRAEIESGRARERLARDRRADDDNVHLLASRGSTAADLKRSSDESRLMWWERWWEQLKHRLRRRTE